jgi:hypothetical protein
MLVKKPPCIKSSEITDKKLYMNRRQFIVGSTALVTSSSNGESTWFKRK